MLDITTITRQNVTSVVGYYSDAKDDYYSKDSSFTSWQGTGAEALGLSGDVESARFKELLVGEIDTFTHMQRHVGDAKKERLGYDLTFSAPKGVSMQALIHGDKTIIEAHEKAVAAAVREAEKLAQARTTRQGKSVTQNTNNLVVATFRHETSRALDPDLHTHAFVMNMTQREDGQWRALKNDELMRNKMHLGDVYKQELALELTKAGYELRYNSKNNTFDMAHFSDEQIRAFSRRSEQIEKGLAAMGLTRETADAQTKSRVSMATREKKTEHSREEIHQEWASRAKTLGIDFDNREWQGHGKPLEADIARNMAPDFTSPEVKADRAIQFAVKSLSERDASFERQKLIQIANKQVLGHATMADVEKAYLKAVQKGAIIEGEARYQSTLKVGASVMAETLTRKEWIDSLTNSGMRADKARFAVDDGIKSGRLKKTSHRVTTVEGIRLERSILTIESRGRGKMPRQLTAEIAGQLLAGKTLKQEQMRAVTEIVTSKDRFVAAHGYAGTGKSYMTMAAKELLESQGLKVTALAPYGTQKKALEDDGLPARTVAAFLKAKDKKLDEKSVVFIDEAGVIPARQMKQLMEVIEKHNARAVFLGDTSQTKAVEAGKPFEQLIKAGMQTSYMKDIQRQKNEVLLEAVKYAAEGNAARALKNITGVNELKEEAPRLAQLADRYLSLSSEQQDATLIISGTNASRKTLNDYIRGNLGLAGTGETFTLLDRVDSTQAERRDSRYFSKGQIIIPEQDYKNGMKRGESYQVLDTGPGNKLTVESSSGEQIAFSPRTHTKLSVYQAVSAELAPGDKVMVTRNDKTLDVANGDRFTVKTVEGEKLTLEDKKGRTVELDKRQASYLSYAYATTVHKSQGLTCDRVLFNIDTKSLTTSKDVFYVGISRARHEVEIFTDDKKSLASSVSRDSPKTTAAEIDRFFGLEARFKDIGRDTSLETRSAEKGLPEATGESMAFNQKPDEHNMTTGTDYQPVSNAEDAFHLKQNPMDDSVGLRRHEAQQNDAELAHDYAAADDQQWSAQEYADYEHYAEASDYDFDSSIYDDYAMPQTSQAEQSHTGKEHTHEHEHEEGGHEI